MGAPFKLGTEMDLVIQGWKWNQVSQTQNHFMEGIKNYISKCFDYYKTTPSFLITGTITEGVMVTPCVGTLGTLSSYNFLPMTTVEWENIIKPTSDSEILSYQFYIRLSKIIKKFFSEKIILTIDAKGIGATTPVPISPLDFVQDTWGQAAQSIMDMARPDNHNDWIQKLNQIGDLIWLNIKPAVNAYSSPCGGGIYNGSHMISFL